MSQNQSATGDAEPLATGSRRGVRRLVGLVSGIGAMLLLASVASPATGQAEETQLPERVSETESEFQLPEPDPRYPVTELLVHEMPAGMEQGGLPLSMLDSQVAARRALGLESNEHLVAELLKASAAQTTYDEFGAVLTEEELQSQRDDRDDELEMKAVLDKASAVPGFGGSRIEYRDEDKDLLTIWAQDPSLVEAFLAIERPTRLEYEVVGVHSSLEELMRLSSILNGRTNPIDPQARAIALATQAWRPVGWGIDTVNNSLIAYSETGGDQVLEATEVMPRIVHDKIPVVVATPLTACPDASNYSSPEIPTSGSCKRARLELRISER